MYVGQVNHILNSESVTTYCPFAVHGRVYVTLATIRAAQRSITTIVKLSLRGQRSLRDENFADRYSFCFFFFSFSSRFYVARKRTSSCLVAVANNARRRESTQRWLREYLGMLIRAADG